MDDLQNFQPNSENWRFYGYRGNWHVVDYLRKTCNLNLMPLRADGSKAPKIPWAGWQIDQTPDEILHRYFVQRSYEASGIGVICGVTSQMLEILDFDGGHLFLPWCRKVAEKLGSDFVKKLVVVQTPKGGYHVYYRSMAIEGNQKLAFDVSGKFIQIETRGQGGQAVMPGSPDKTHLSQRPYRLLRGTFDAIPWITSPERNSLIDVARGFDLAPPKPPKPPQNAMDWVRLAYNLEEAEKDRPGDDFNERAEWTDILVPAGWSLLREAAGVSYWQRPGKIGTGPSATTGFCSTDSGKQLMKIFSSNCSPLEQDQAYDKFAIYTWLNHAGDFRAAAESISQAGYGKYAQLARNEEIVNEIMQRNYSS